MLISRYSVVIFLLIVWGSILADDNIIAIPDAKITTDQDNANVHTGTVVNVTVISAKQIQRMGAVSLPQVLQNYAGLQVQDLYGDGSQVLLSMSGFGDNSAQNIKVLVNGIPINNPDLSTVDLNQVMVQDIQRIEIFNGSSGILFGDGAVGGVINIITKKPKKFSGNLGLSAGSYNQHIFTGSMSDTVNNWQYYLSGQQKHNAGFRDNNQSDSGNYNSEIIYNHPNGWLALHLQQVEEQEEYPGALTAEQVANNPEQVGSGAGNYNSIDRITELFLRQDLNQHWWLSGQSSAHNLEGYGNLFSDFNEQRSVQTLNPELIGSYDTEKGAIISTSGVYAEKDRYELSSVDSQDQRNVEAVYSQMILPLAKTWQLSAGARYAAAQSYFNGSTLNDQENNKAFIDSFGLSWQPVQNFRWYLTRAGNYRFPKLDELESVAENNQQLQAQTGMFYGTGFDYHWDIIDNRLDIYQLNLNNEIAYNPTPQPGEPFGANVNLDPTKRQGLLLTEALQVLQSWQIGGQYAYVDGRFSSGDFSGNRIPLVARDKFTLFSNASLNSSWTWYAAGILVGDRYPGSDNSNTQSLLEKTIVMNTNIGYHVKQWRLALQVNNITNKAYVESGFVNGNNEVGYYPAPGRNLLLSLNYEY